MRRTLARVLALSVAGAIVLAAGACREPEPPTAWIEAIVVSDAEVAAHPILGVDADALETRAGRALLQGGGLRLGRGGSDDRERFRATVRIVHARTRGGPLPDEPGASADANRAEVSVELGLGDASGERLRGLGDGRRAFVPGEPERRTAAFLVALDEALAAAAQDLVRQLEAARKSDAELVADLGLADRIRVELAVRTLADRRAAVAVPALVELLRDGDRELQLRAIAALATIGDRAAVPALIDVTANKDPSFVARAVFALGDLGGEDAEAFLFTASTGHPEIVVRRSAEEALGSLRENARRAATMKSEREPGPASP